MILVDIMCNNAKYNILKVVGWISTFMCGLRCERQCEGSPWYVKVEIQPARGRLGAAAVTGRDGCAPGHSTDKDAGTSPGRPNHS